MLNKILTERERERETEKMQNSGQRKPKRRGA